MTPIPVEVDPMTPLLDDFTTGQSLSNSDDPMTGVLVPHLYIRLYQRNGAPMDGHLGELERLVLLALVRLGDDAYGVAVQREITARTGRAMSFGTVYTTLGRLE